MKGRAEILAAKLYSPSTQSLKFDAFSSRQGIFKQRLSSFQYSPDWKM